MKRMESGLGPLRVIAGSLQGDRWTAENVTLFMLIRQAYGQLMQGQIEGGPDWLQADRFSISAKAARPPSPDELRAMVKALLAERFKLQVHTEKRELPVFALVLARDDKRLGPKMATVDVDCEAVAAARRSGAAPPPPPPQPDGPPPPCSTMMMMGTGVVRVRSGGLAPAQIASVLSQSVGRPVVDHTGLSGYYSIDVEFAPEPGAGSPFGPAPAAPPQLAADATERASVFSAVQEQLGLKLEGRREPIDVLVVDSAERPVED